jgi:hypothetical protein
VREKERERERDRGGGSDVATCLKDFKSVWAFDS